MTLHDALRIGRKRWLSICVIAATCALVAVGYGAASPKVYSASAQDFVAIGGIGATSNAAVYSGSSFALQRVKSYIGVVDTPQVLQPIIDDLGLDITPQALAGRISAANPPQTVLLTVTVTGTDPQQVALIANAGAVHLGTAIEALETPAGGTAPVKVTQVLQAATPTTPVSPRLGINLALGLLLGLGLGIGLALLRELFDTSLQTPDALADVTGGTPLGVVGRDDADAAGPLAALDRSSARGEAYRTIRTNLQYVDVDNPPRAIAVTSALPGEGKTTVSCNLAVVLAQAGVSVCLVEADLRRPAAAHLLGVDSALGLTDVLAGTLALEQAIVPWRRGLLSVIPAGRVPPNPSELLGSMAMRATLADLVQRFDVVLLDAAPLLPVAALRL